jgi:hypothetical protein
LGGSDADVEGSASVTPGGFCSGFVWFGEVVLLVGPGPGSLGEDGGLMLYLLYVIIAVLVILVLLGILL